MAITFDTTIRNARLDAIKAAIGPSPTLRIRTGAPPASANSASTGTVLATCALPADWMAAAANGTKAMSGVWQDAAADAAGTAGHYEIVGAATTRGTVTVTGGGGDMTVDNTNFAAGQAFSVTSYNLTDGNG